MFTNNTLNEDQIKQIEENSIKQTNIPLFNPNKIFDKTSNNFFELNTNSIINNISNPNIFTKDIKLFNQPQPKINLNLNNQETKNIINNNSLNLVNNLNNNENEPKNKINTNSSINSNKILFSTSKIDTINNNKQLNNSFNRPVSPSFFCKEDIKNNFSFANEEKTENNTIKSNIMNMNNNINANLIQSMNYPIDGNNIFINPMTNNINKIDNIIKYKEPLIVKNPNNNFLNEFNSIISKLLFPGITQPPFICSMNNNFLSYPINPLNSYIKPPSMNIPQNNNINNVNVNSNTNMNEKSK